LKKKHQRDCPSYDRKKLLARATLQVSGEAAENPSPLLQTLCSLLYLQFLKDAKLPVFLFPFFVVLEKGFLSSYILKCIQSKL
jgi:hypothetical protein